MKGGVANFCPAQEKKKMQRERTRLHHGLRLLRRARRDVGQRPGRLKLQRWATEQRETNEHQINLHESASHSRHGSYLSSLSRQCTRMGRIPDLIRSSMGGLRSLDSSFLQDEGDNIISLVQSEEARTKHSTAATRHRDEERLLTWRPERR